MTVSNVAQKLINKTHIYTSPEIMKEGLSKDAMVVFGSIAIKEVERFIDTISYVAVDHELMQKLKNVAVESIGIGYKLYWTEQTQFKGKARDEIATQHSGAEFVEYLYQTYVDYFIETTKSRDVFPQYVLEAVHHFGSIMVLEGVVKNEELRGALGLSDGNMRDDAYRNIILLIDTLIFAGYVLSVSQAHYADYSRNQS